MGAESNPLPYLLCAVTGIAFMLNVILLAWHCLRLESTSWLRLVKYSTSCLNVTYICTTVALALLILYKDLETDLLCKIGGVLILYSTQQSLWDLSACGISLLLWQRTQKPWQPIQLTQPEPSWTRSVFVFVMVTKFLFVAIISTIPQLNINHFDDDYLEYYLCTPLRLPGEQSWGYSTLIIILHWCALLVLFSVVIANAVLHRRRVNGFEYSRKSWQLFDEDSKTTIFVWRTVVVLSSNAVCWMVTMLVASISYFTKGEDMEQDGVKWTLGFCIGLTVLFHPALTFALKYLFKGCGVGGCCSSSSGICGKDTSERGSWGKCPSSLHSLVNCDDLQQTDGVSKFEVQWYSKKDDQLLTGTMKVFDSSALGRWKNEVNVLTKLSPSGHPNIAQYMWYSQRNNFSTAIRTFTGKNLGPEASVVCRARYHNGTLRHYLDSSIQRLTEVSLHKVTLDIANGLDYLHQHHVVHNGLTTHTVLMASVSEKVGLKVVLSDFENSYEVPPDASKPKSRGSEAKKQAPHLSDLQACHVFSLSGQMGDTSLENDKFAPDIRSFGLIVMEILVSMSEYNQRRAYQKRVAPYVVNEPVNPHREAPQRRSSTVRENATVAHVHGPNSKCSCSSRVTDLRVCKDRDEQIKPNHLLLVHLENSPGVFIERTQESTTDGEITMTDSQGQCGTCANADSAFVTRHQGRVFSERAGGPVPEQKEVVVDGRYLVSPGTSMDSGLGEGEAVEREPQLQLHQHQPSTHVSQDSQDERTCATSAGSMCSFETIYEDPELTSKRPSNKGIYVKNSLPPSGANRRVAKQVPHIRRKIGPGDSTSQSSSKAKRLSSASLDESIASLDSGLGSSHYDGDKFVGGFHTQLVSPGSRETIYSDNATSSSDCDSYSLMKGFVDRNNEVLFNRAVSEGRESNVDGSPVLPDVIYEEVSPDGIDNDVERDDAEQDFGFPDLRLRKQPCVANHPHPCPGHGHHGRTITSVDDLHDSDRGVESKPSSHTCGQTEAMYKSFHDQENSPAVAEKNFVKAKVVMVDQATGMSDNEDTLRKRREEQQEFCETRSNISVQTTGTKSSDYNVTPQSAFTPPQCRKCPSCGSHKERSEASASPLAQSDCGHFQVKRSTPTLMPKLGVSAFRGRRMSDASVISNHSYSSSAAQIDSCADPVASDPRLIKKHVPCEHRPSSHQRGSATVVDSRAMQPGAASRAPGRIPSVTPSAASTSSYGPSQVNRSATSSVLSILQDSGLLIDSLYSSKPMPHPAGRQNHSASVTSSRATSAASGPSRSSFSTSGPQKPGPRTGLGPGQVTYCQDLLKQHPALLKSTALMTSPSHQKLLGMLSGVKKKGHLGFTAGQLLPLLSDCWLEDPAPSAEQILRRLDQVLPTAIV